MAQNYWSVYEEPKWPSHAPTLNILSSKYTGDFSDTDSELSDDGDYIALKSRFERKANVKFLTKERVSSIEGLTDEQKGIHYKRRAAETASAGLVDATIETIKRGKPYGLNCDTDVRDGWTPLMLAARGGHFELMNAFIRKTASLNCERDGVTLLMMVCSLPYYTSPYEKTVSMVAKLVRFGANVNLVDKRRKNALMYAAEVGNLLVVQALLPLCDKDYVDNQRWNALTWAVSNNQVQVVQFLYENGFAIDVVDVRGNTAVDIAVQKGFDSIIEIFPKAESDLIEEILGNQNLSFEDIFKNLKKGERPSFFENVCNFLLAVKCGHLIPIFSEKKVTLYDLLSSNEEDLKTFGVHLPFQRKRILTGLHRFHRHPYHPKSLHICIKDPTYSNVDVATQLLSSIKQQLCMEASLKYLLKHFHPITEDTEEIENRTMMKHSIDDIQETIHKLKYVVKELQNMIEKWDDKATPADAITEKSEKIVKQKNGFPWRKFPICVGAIFLIGCLLVGKNTINKT